MTSTQVGPDPAAEPDGSDPVAGGRHLARNLAIGVGIVLVLFIALLATRQPSESRFGANPMVGRAVPKVAGTTLDGERIDIDALRGKWVVVNFFATWCTPCIVEHPELIAFSEAHEAEGDAVVISVAFDDSQEKLREFFAANGGDWPVIPSDDARMALEFGVTGVPESFVVSPAGQVVAHFTGVTAAGLDQVIADWETTSSPGTVL